MRNLRNFFKMLRTFKTASLLNLVGMSVAFTAFFTIIALINFEYSFETFRKDVDQIHRVTRSSGGYSMLVNPRPMCELMAKSNSQIEHAAYANPFSVEYSFNVETNGQKQGFMFELLYVSEDYFNIFDFDIVEGDINGMKEPKTLMLCQRDAMLMFGSKSSIGESVWVGGDKYTVKAVYKNLPNNTLTENVIYSVMDPKENIDSWNNQNYVFFVKLTKEANIANVSSDMLESFRKESPSWMETPDDASIDLTPISELYFSKPLEFDLTPKGNKAMTMVLLCIGILVIAIATINFINFSTALTPLRIKSINTQKVLGSSSASLRTRLILEAVYLSTIAYVVSLFLIYIISLTNLTQYFSADISLGANIGLAIQMLVVAIIIGLLAGLYPAFYMTSFAPAMVLKGAFGLSKQGRLLRTSLICFQYIVSIGLIIAALFFDLQNRYVVSMDIGFEKDNTLVVRVPDELGFYGKNNEAFYSEMKKNAAIVDVAFCANAFGTSDFYSSWGRVYKDENINFDCIRVSDNFLTVMNIPIVDGENFKPSSSSREDNVITYAFNEDAVSRYSLVLGDSIDNGVITAVFKNIIFKSARQSPTSLALIVMPKIHTWGSLTFMFVKVAPGSEREAIGHIKSTVSKFDSAYPTDPKFYDKEFEQMYKKEAQTKMFITLFSVLAVIISIMGVLGLVIFETSYRTKEIGVRKIMGAKVGEILVMFNRSFVGIVAGCFIVAAPLAWYGVDKWLEGFVYRTPMYWWVYVLAFLLVLAITVVTVTLQSYKAATANPAQSIKG